MISLSAATQCRLAVSSFAFVAKRAPSSYAKRALHNVAIARELPNSFEHALSQHYENNSSNNEKDTNTTKNDSTTLDMNLARQQHEQYLVELRKLLPVHCLAAEEAYPDSCFVEDVVIAIGNRALITTPGHESRRGEVDSIRIILQQMGMEVMDMKEEFDKLSPNKKRSIWSAHCDGGDVLYTGRHLFVGVSERTNEEALQVLEHVFPDIPLVPVAPVVQGRNVLHLKSAVTHLDGETLLAPADPMGHKVLRAMRAQELGYTAIRLPDVLTCNVVSVSTATSTTALAQDTTCQQSRDLLQEAALQRNIDVKWVDTSELAKKDAALTCCSVLLGL